MLLSITLLLYVYESVKPKEEEENVPGEQLHKEKEQHEKEEEDEEKEDEEGKIEH